MGAIHFFNEDVNFSLPHKKPIRCWIEEVLNQHHFQLKEINYIFCSDDYLLEINQQFLKHNTYTDIVTFDQSENYRELTSDIFISIDRVKENARILKTSMYRELHRVMIHGVLHLMGYKDKTESQKKAMREKEDACISLLNSKI